MDSVLRDMIQIYKPLDLDWMNYKVVRNSDLTIHHIHKKADGGKRTIDNSALLIETSHQYLNLIEVKELDMYIELNRIFKQINTQKSPPTTAQRMLVEEILTLFEHEHRNDKNSKGKTLIQYKYRKRW